MNSEQPSATSDQPSVEAAHEVSGSTPDALPPSRSLASAKRRALMAAVEDLRDAIDSFDPEDREAVLDAIAEVPGLTRAPYEAGIMRCVKCPCCEAAITWPDPEPSRQTIRREIATAALVGYVHAGAQYANLEPSAIAELAVSQADALIAALRTIPHPNAEAH